MNQITAQECKDTREGKPQLISNIEIWSSIAEYLKTTLGPYGMDKMFVKGNDLLITNDGATILKNMQLSHPAGKLLASISEAQDKEVGDGTTSVVVLASAILCSLKPLIKEDFPLEIIVECLDESMKSCLEILEGLAIKYDNSLLTKLAETTLSSKILKEEKTFFGKMVVRASKGDSENLGIKKVQGGSFSDSVLVEGVAFEKCFTYAGYEQQPKKIVNPAVLACNIELEWKSERDNAEIRVSSVEDYESFVNAEWSIIRTKLDQIINSGAKVVLSLLPIGDYATQYFARKGIFCAGRVSKDDLERVVKMGGGRIVNSTNHLDGALGYCDVFEERQCGKTRYNYFSKSSDNTPTTIILRGPGEEILNEMERSLHDALCVVRKVSQFNQVVTGGGSVDIQLSRKVRELAFASSNKKMFVFRAIAQALEVIPFQLATNFGLDAVSTMQEIRRYHEEGYKHYGVNLEKICSDMLEDGVVEPLMVKKNMIKAAFGAVKGLIMIDSTLMTKL
ncbi:T-complex protein 1 subunit eta [Astathelohania contejeani]|uniref:T-complex protein 1 subunit eta n=1 Tax=Astathelohania contejeani TaxID=164912 RepID=A0ABQ7I1E0_9MICR|nr:T-complex protein 1 subunit eta [Thelohania contejeani]